MPQVRIQAIRAPPQVHQTEDQFGDYEDEFEEAFQWRKERRIPRTRTEVDNLSSIKTKIPIFKGTRDPDSYLDRERKVDVIFDCHNYSEGKKVKIVLEFSDYVRKLNLWLNFLTMLLVGGRNFAKTE